MLRRALPLAGALVLVVGAFWFWLRPTAVTTAQVTAREMLNAGGLWNTMVMVCRAKTLVGLVRGLSPRLHGFFERIRKAIGTSSEREAIAEAYRSIEPVNFSTGLLESFALEHASRLLVLPVRGVTWSDWGSEQRLVRTLRRIGYRDCVNEYSTSSCP